MGHFLLRLIIIPYVISCTYDGCSTMTKKNIRIGTKTKYKNINVIFNQKIITTRLIVHNIHMNNTYLFNVAIHTVKTMEGGWGLRKKRDEKNEKEINFRFLPFQYYNLRVCTYIIYVFLFNYYNINVVYQ